MTITSGQECVLLPLKKNKRGYTYTSYLPAMLPIYGKYNDYGGIEDIEKNNNTELIEKHFNMNIDEFCEILVEEPEKHNNPEVQKLRYMWIDRKVYDFLGSWTMGAKGYLSMGTPELLKYMGFKESEIDTKDTRYKYAWEYNGVIFKSDGEWIHQLDTNQGIYRISDLSKYFPLNAKMRELQVKTSWEVYNIDEKTAFEKMMWILQVPLTYQAELDSKKTMEKISKEQGIPTEIHNRFYERFTNLRNKMGIVANYCDNFLEFAPEISKLVSLRHNMYAMSKDFKPFTHYLTPQCGEREHHQVILEKIAEIHKTYIDDEEY